MENLCLFKLTSGNTVIAKAERQQLPNQENRLHKPLEVIIVPNPQNPQQTVVTLMDFMPGLGQDFIEIGDRHVITRVSKVDEQIAELYQKITEPSAIAQPSQKLMVPGQ